jgi:5-methylcytosine-specific restriction endonuclease McrA
LVRENRFCSVECRAATQRKYASQQEARRAERARARARKGMPEPAPRLTACRVCSVPLPASGPRVAFCCDACRAQHARQVARQAASAATAANRTARQCRECGSSFAPDYGVKLRAFCGEICRKRHGRRIRRKMERARLRAVQVESVNPIRVFERDGWRCHICGRRTPREHRGTQKATAPELDHIVPLAAGGPHSYGNTACACRRCNHRKGARTYGQPSLLAA